MNTTLDQNETILRTGQASLQRGIETVGGTLYLTTSRLVFESHAFNVQRGATAIALSEVSSVVTCWTKFLNLIPLIPNSLSVRTSPGREYRFVLFGRDAWIAAIEAAQQGSGR